ncbi:MAG: hypothetical protein QGF00_19305 [Planctomycetota bacterium]|nr:hypothetical protein [Planctomycetota bacterium]
MYTTREKTGLPWRALCDTTAVKYSSLMRWQHRLAHHEPVVQQPGPKKVEPLDLGRLQPDIDALRHRNKRTYGTSELHQRYAQSISRRDFAELVDQARRDARKEHRAMQRTIEWHLPGLVWSIDESELWKDTHGNSIKMLTVQDMSSAYKFQPLVATSFHGEEIAGHLKSLFRKYGPPLYLKRDNGGNLNHQAVNETLSNELVLPLNSPTYYPPYNGAIGRGQGEIKEALREKLKYRPACPTEHVEAWAATAANDRNHQERHRLKGRNSCQTFFTDKDRARHHRRLRKEIYDALIEKQTIIVAAMEERNKRDKEAAWRIAVEQWLVKNQHITITHNPDVSPHFQVSLIIRLSVHFSTPLTRPSIGFHAKCGAEHSAAIRQGRCMPARKPSAIRNTFPGHCK